MKPKNSTLRSSFISLSIIQAINYLFPLITIPFLARTLGADSLGKLAFAYTIIGILTALSDYGFTWSATQKIAANRGDYDNVSKTASATWISQLLLSLISSVILVLIVLSFPDLRKDAPLYLSGIVMTIGSAISPAWLFQGLEKMKYLAIHQVCGRSISIVLLFIFIKDSADTTLALLITGLGTALSGVLSITWIKCNDTIRFKPPGARDIFETIRYANKFFLSRISIAMYTRLIPLAVGITNEPATMANYYLADKIRAAAQAVMQPISQALYPRLSMLYKTAPLDATQLVRKSSAFIWSIAIIISAILYISSDLLVFWLGGEEYLNAEVILKFMSPIPLFVAVSNTFGVQVLFANAKTQVVNITTAIVAIFASIACIPAAQYYGAEGASILLVASEFAVAASFAAYGARTKHWTKVS